MFCGLVGLGQKQIVVLVFVMVWLGLVELGGFTLTIPHFVLQCT